jgi:translocation and assembly module TamA
VEPQFDVKGVSGDALKNVTARLVIEWRDVNIEGAGSVERFAQASQQAVKDAMAPYGYYQPQMHVAVKQGRNGPVILYVIEPGQPIKISDVDVRIEGEGGQNKKILRAVEQFPLKRGEIFNSESYVAARDKLFDVISNEGYIKAQTNESKVYVDSAKHTAVIRLIVTTHARYYFGKITFNKNAYDPAFMQRFDTFATDQPFSSRKLLQYQQDMNGSRYFKQVIVIPDLNHTNDVYVPVQASVVPVNYRRYDFGLGYGTFTGPRFTAGVQFRRITNTGHSLETLLKLSNVLSGLGVKYNIPGGNPLIEQWTLGANLQKFAPKNGSSHSKTLTFGYQRKMHRWQLTTNINYLWERYTVDSKPVRNSQLLSPNLNITYLKTDNIAQPTYGRSFNLTLQGASSSVLSSTSFLQAEMKGKLFMTPFSFAHVILRGNVGYTVVNDLNDLPLSMRFFIGGMTTVRGYPESSIGPGKYLGVASIEYRNHIAYDLSGAVFFDIGTATNHIGTPLNQGAGVGLVYESPVGPVKLYLSQAINKRGRPYSIEFSMGPEF